MAETTCRRELELEIPVEDVKKTVERVAREFARVARVPGFRPGKAPVPLIRRRFADDVRPSHDHSILPSNRKLAALQYLDDASRRARSQPRLSALQPSGIPPQQTRASGFTMNAIPS